MEDREAATKNHEPAPQQDRLKIYLTSSEDCEPELLEAVGVDGFVKKGDTEALNVLGEELANRSLWVVDDEAAPLNSIESVLTRHEVSVRVFRHPDALLEALREEGLPDAILSDITMPGMNGLRLAQILRNKDQAVLVK